MEQRTAEEAYAAFCGGDQSAFDQIMHEFRQGLIFFLRSYVKSYETAEDLAEDTFVELIIHQGRFRGQSSLKTFIYSVARHKAIDHIRREQRRPTVALDEIDHWQGDEDTPEEHYLAQERAQVIANAIATLSPDYQEVLRLLYLERLSYDDIARIMRKSNKQIDNLAYRARNTLRTALGKEAEYLEES
ncbi:MAG: RNA polymerase sigma factor [Oscillospiraceae bacterium]|nr:RNA polymerase sigma factor [Oscillospiraceae bacterium]